MVIREACSEKELPRWRPSEWPARIILRGRAGWTRKVGPCTDELHPYRILEARQVDHPGGIVINRGGIIGLSGKGRPLSVRRTALKGVSKSICPCFREAEQEGRGDCEDACRQAAYRHHGRFSRFRCVQASQDTKEG